MIYRNWISTFVSILCITNAFCSPLRDINQLKADSLGNNISGESASFTVEYDRNSLTLRLNFTCSSALTNPLTNTIQVEIDKEYGQDFIFTYRRPKKLCLHRDAHSCDQHLQVNQEVCQVEFHYIYAGRYCFTVTEYNNSTKLNVPIGTECEKYIDSEPEPDVFEWNPLVDTWADPVERNIKMELILNQPDAFRFEYFHMDIYRMEKMNGNCFETKDAQNIHIDFNGTVSRQLFSFANLSQGFYCLVIDPEDERCEFAYEPNQTCTRHYIYEISEAAVSIREVVTGKNGTFNFTLVASIGLVVLLLIIYSAFYFGRNGSLAAVREASYKPVAPVQTTGHSLLLLYCQRSLSQHVHDLKMHLKAYKILDRADPGDESVDIEGIHWFANRLCDQRTKVVVIRCPEMVRCEQIIRHNALNDDNDRDLLSLYHLVSVMGLDPSTQYQRVFVVSFDSLPVGRNVLFNLTPRRSYRLPGDLHQLLRDLGDS